MEKMLRIFPRSRSLLPSFLSTANAYVKEKIKVRNISIDSKLDSFDLLKKINTSNKFVPCHLMKKPGPDKLVNLEVPAHSFTAYESNYPFLNCIYPEEMKVGSSLLSLADPKSETYQQVSNQLNTIFLPENYGLNLKIHQLWIIKSDSQSVHQFDKSSDKEEILGLPFRAYHGTSINNVESIIENGFRNSVYVGKRMILGCAIYFADLIALALEHTGMFNSPMPYLSVFAVDIFSVNNIMSTSDDKFLHDNFNSSDLPQGCTVVTARGKHVPEGFQKHYDKDFKSFIYVPIDRIITDHNLGSSIDYNEYGLYNRKHLRLRYLIILKNKSNFI